MTWTEQTVSTGELNLYVERDNNAVGANTVFAGKRYWLVGYCEGDGIWNSEGSNVGTWAQNSSSPEIWSDA